MIRRLLTAVLFGGLAFAQTTPNLHLNIPAQGAQNWDVLLNQNFSTLDSMLYGGEIKPKSLNNIQFADQYSATTPALQVSAACIAGGAGTTVIVSNSVSAGSLGTIPVDCQVLDYRASSFAGNYAGVFTNTQMNEYVQSLLGGASPASEWAAVQLGSFATDAIAGAVAVPVGATVHNSNSVAGYISNSSTASNSVAGYFQSRCLVNGSHCWGGNTVVIDTAGLTNGVAMHSYEIDLQPQNAPSAYSLVVGAAANLISPYSGIFTGANAFAAAAQNPSGVGNPTAIWDNAFVSDDGQAATALKAGASCLSPSTCNSQKIKLIGFTAGVVKESDVYADQNGAFSFDAANGIMVGYQAGTQKALFSFAANTAARTYTWPDASGNVVLDSATQTLTNKSSAAGPLTGTVASGTATMTTALIAAGACGTTVTVAASGVLTTDVVEASPNAAVGANPGVLIIQKWPTAGNVNFAYCNPTAGSVTPSAMTLNWRISR